MLIMNTVSCALEFGLCIFMGAHSIGFDVRDMRPISQYS